eukprot:357902-Chlamydomonas_euryale.AAC.16
MHERVCTSARVHVHPSDEGLRVHVWIRTRQVWPTTEQLGTKELLTAHCSSVITRAAVHLAAGGGHTECVSLLLEKSDEDAEDGDGNTPLWAAVSGGHGAAASAVVKAGADVNLACSGGATALHAAAGLGSAEMMDECVRGMQGRGASRVEEGKRPGSGPSCVRPWSPGCTGCFCAALLARLLGFRASERGWRTGHACSACRHGTEVVGWETEEAEESRCTGGLKPCKPRDP